MRRSLSSSTLSESESARVNTYDFDQTIYRRDSSADFWRYCLRRHPLVVLPTLPKTIRSALAYARGRIDTRTLKEQLFSFLPGIDAEAEAKCFWRSHWKGIWDWYLAQRRDDDVVISASPEFLLRPMAEELGFCLIGTPMDPATGKIGGLNCHDAEKVRRFHERFPDARVDEFYSDSLSDTPMARLARRAFLIRRGRRLPWPEHHEGG